MTRADVWLLAQILVPVVLAGWMLLRLVPDTTELTVRGWAPDPGLVEDAEVALLESWWELPSAGVGR